MSFNRISLVLFYSLVIYSLAVPGSAASEKMTVGYLEYVKFNQNQFKFKAKIDTGATISSLNAKILSEFELGDDKWIRFRIDDEQGQSIILERKIQRYVNIKRKNTTSLMLPIIEIGICLGKTYRQVEVNLSNREEYLYPVLIGRNYLDGSFVVDPELQFTVKPSCKTKI